MWHLGVPAIPTLNKNNQGEKTEEKPKTMGKGWIQPNAAPGVFFDYDSSQDMPAANFWDKGGSFGMGDSLGDSGATENVKKTWSSLLQEILLK